MYLFRIAFKNIFRHKRKTILNVIAFAINILCIITFTVFERGKIVNSYSKGIDYVTSHIQIHNPEYEKEKRLLPLDITVKESEKIVNDFKNHKWVKGISERIDFSLFINNGINQLSAIGIAIHPEEETKIGVIKEMIVKGDYIKKGQQGILIGSRMASLLDLDVGDLVFLYVHTALNQSNIIEATISGIFHYNYSVFDKTTVFCDYDYIKPQLNMPEGATKIMIRLHNRNQIPKMMDELSLYNQSEFSGGLQINRWEFFSGPLLEDIKTEQTFMNILFFILILIALFGIINSMSTSIFERTKEIGTIRAIGMKRNLTLRLFLYESVIISTIGVIIGWILGFCVSIFLAKVGISLESLRSEEMMTVPMGTHLYGVMHITEYLGTLVLGICAGVLGGIAPAFRASRLRIIEALRK